MCISLDIPRMAWDIVTWYVINDRDMTIGIQLKKHCLKLHNLTQSYNKQYAAFTQGAKSYSMSAK